MHIRSLRASVDMEEDLSESSLSTRSEFISSDERRSSRLSQQSQPQLQPQSGRPKWATQPLAIPRGRVIGVRLHGALIEVSLLAKGTTQFKWVLADGLLSHSQIGQWLKTANFSER